jgi:hypothetical protein
MKTKWDIDWAWVSLMIICAGIGISYSGPLGGAVILMAISLLTHELVHFYAAKSLGVTVIVVSLGWHPFIDIQSYNHQAIARVYLAGFIWEYTLLCGILAALIITGNLVFGIAGSLFFLSHVWKQCTDNRSDSHQYLFFRDWHIKEVNIK